MFVATAPHAVAARPRPSGRRIPALAGLAALAVAALASNPGAAQAWGRGPSVDRETTVYQGPLAIGIKVRGGTTPLFQAANRPDRWYLQAREGASYEVNVRNTSDDRIAFVIAVDGINADHGRATLRFAASGVEQGWKLRCDQRSARFTTEWQELLTVAN